MSQDPQSTWAQYYSRIRDRRIAEARVLHRQLKESGVGDETILAIDFQHFGNVEDDVRKLANQLSESYSMIVVQRGDTEYWDAKGTTRPDGVDGMDEGTCLSWVAFMCDVANSYACVFSTWSLTDQIRGQTWANETIDVDP